LFHHARELAHVRFEAVRQTPVSKLLAEPDCSNGCDRPEDDFHNAVWCDAAYAWIAECVGFWPLFLAVGEHDDDRRMTGYADRRPPSRVLFSWRQAPPHTNFMDFDAWHVVLNSVQFSSDDPHHPRVEPVGASWERRIWKRSWRASDWVRMARRQLTSVQAVVPELDLRTADVISCRYQVEARRLIESGFHRSKIFVSSLRRG